MPRETDIPRILLIKIEKQRPDVYLLLKQLEKAREDDDSAKQKSLRSKLRRKGFYLSRLSEGEDPFVHDSLWCDEQEMDIAAGELMTEDQVVELFTAWLAKDGWEIITKCLGHQRGIDILAIKGTQSLIVEAKGSKGNSESHLTKKDKFSKSQIKSHFGRALVKVFEEKSKNLGAKIAIVQPNDHYLKGCLKDAAPEVLKAGIELYWVDVDGSVETGFDFY